MMIPITPQGTVLGTVGNEGSVFNASQQIVGRVLANGLVKDVSGSEVIAQMIRGGLVVGYGCKQIGLLDSDGKIRKNNQIVDAKINFDGTVTNAAGDYLGEVVPTGKVLDNNCSYLGDAGTEGVVKTAGGKYVGCVNPDGTVLDEKGVIIGSVVKSGLVVDYNNKYLGQISENGLVVNGAQLPVGCVGIFGDVLNKKSFEIFSDKIVLGIGRKGAGWLSDICQRHNIETAVGSVDIGVRYELPDDVMREINTYLYEGKFIGRPKPFCDRVRTFCQNPSGFVSAEVYDNNLTLVNGHSYKDRKSTNTNLAILVSHNFNTPFNKPIEYGENIAENVNRLAAGSVLVQRFGDILNGKRTWERELLTNSVKPTLKSAVAGDITYAIGFRTMTDIINFIKQVDHVVPGFAGEDNLLYAPEIKFYSNTVVVDKNFETSVKNLFCIGDGGGLTTGLMMASASGVKMARNLISLEDKN